MAIIAATRTFVVGEILSAANMNTFISQLIEQAAGRRNPPLEIEDSVVIQNGTGSRYLGLPRGTTGQRPTVPNGHTALRYNTSLSRPEYNAGSGWQTMAPEGAVTFERLDANNDVGTAANTLAEGNHTHDIANGSYFGDRKRQTGAGLTSVVSWTTVGTLTVTGNPGAVALSGVIEMDHSQIPSALRNLQMRFLRGSTVVGSGYAAGSDNVDDRPVGHAVVDDNPGTSYSFQIRNNGSVNIRHFIFYALGLTLD